MSAVETQLEKEGHRPGVARRTALRLVAITAAMLLLAMAAPGAGSQRRNGVSPIAELISACLGPKTALAADAAVFNQWHAYSGSQSSGQVTECKIVKVSDSSYKFYFRTYMTMWGWFTSNKEVVIDGASSGLVASNGGYAQAGNYINLYFTRSWPGSYNEGDAAFATLGPGSHHFQMNEWGPAQVDCLADFWINIPYPSYKITFVGNGGTLTAFEDGLTDMVADVQIQSTAYSRLAITPYRANYNFLGFYDSASGGTAIYSASTVSSADKRLKCVNNDAYWHDDKWCHYGNTTAYAHWEYRPYLDLAGTLDGVDKDELGGYGKADVWINGKKVGSGVTDWGARYDKGTTYKIVASATGNHRLTSVATFEGTLGTADVIVRPTYTSTYAVACEDWWVDSGNDRKVRLATRAAKTYDRGATPRGSDWGTSYGSHQYVGCSQIDSVAADGTVYRYWKCWVDLNLLTPNGKQSPSDGNRVWVTLENSNGTFAKTYNEPSSPNSCYYYGETAVISNAGTSEGMWRLRSHSPNITAREKDVGECSSTRDYESYVWQSTITTTDALVMSWDEFANVGYYVDGEDASHLAMTDDGWVGETYRYNDAVLGLTLPNGKAVVREGCTPGFAGFYTSKADGLGKNAPTAAPFASVVLSGNLNLYAANRCTISRGVAEAGYNPVEGSGLYETPSGTPSAPTGLSVIDAQAHVLESSEQTTVRPVATVRSWLPTKETVRVDVPKALATPPQPVTYTPIDGHWRSSAWAGWIVDGTDGAGSVMPAKDTDVYAHWELGELQVVETVRAD